MTDVDPDSGSVSISLDTTPPLPIFLPVIVSDAIYNMRAALDYIVYELARLDSGAVQDGTQFLIEDVKLDPEHPSRGFDARSKRCLKGLTQAHIAAIEALQPYRGIEWTRTLRDISNPDKHRTLTVLTDRFGDFTITEHGGLHQFTPGSGVQLFSEGVKEFRWTVDASYAITIGDTNLRAPVLMSTLRQLQAGVVRTVESFWLEFPAARASVP